MFNWSILLLTLLFAVSTNTSNTEPKKTAISCGTDFLHERKLQESDAYKQQHQALEGQISQYIQARQNKGLATYTLPVVVHIIHNNGPENISDAAVIQGIDDLNAAYENTGYYDQGTGVNTQFEFCLAKRDPSGNATTGITRNVSPLTEMTMETDDIDVKNLNRWSPTEYINIWLVREICSLSSGCGVAGYAYFPSAHGSNIDGIMNEAGLFGSSNGNSTVHTHEMGHYLGLYHTFQGGCTNNDCTTDGDRVCDTPPDQSKAAVPCSGTANTCSTDANSGFPSDQNDLFINYMDYGDRFCYSMFTQGQADRMDFFINTTRSSLLASQACQDPCLSSITANFLASTTMANIGDNVTFTNLSTGATTYEWLVDGVPFSSTTNANYNFNTAGTFTITLQATNADPNCYDEYSLDITVTCAVEADFSASYFYPEPGQQVDFTNTSTNATSYTWTIDNTTFATSTNSNYTFPNTGSYEICLEADNGLCSDMQCKVVFVYLESTNCNNTFIKAFGDTSHNELAEVILPVPQGGFLIGGSRNDSCEILRLGADSQLLWRRTFKMSNSRDVIYDLKFDPDGTLVGTGMSQNLGSNNTVCFAFKYDYLTDNMIWGQNMAAPSESRVYTIHAISATDNYYITGQTANNGGTGCDALLLELDRNTGVLVNQNHYTLGSCESIYRSKIHNNEIYATGRYNQAGGGSSRMRSAISKFDLNGNEVFSRLYLVDVNQNARIYGTDFLIENNAIFAISQGDLNGTSTTATSIQLYETDLQGNIAWAKDYNISGGDGERPKRIVSVPDGFIIGGQYTNLSSSENFLLKVDKQGNVLWAKNYTIGEDDFQDMIIDGGFIYSLGNSQYTGFSSIVLAKLTLDGELLEPCPYLTDLTIQTTDLNNPYDGSHPLSSTNLSISANPYSINTQFAEGEEVDFCATPCIEICGNGIDDDEDGYIDNFDGDCREPEDCVTNNIDQNFSSRLAWESSVDAANVSSTPIVANLNPNEGDLPEIIIPTSDNVVSSGPQYNLLIFQGDGSDRTNPKSLSISTGYDPYPSNAPAIGDVNRDGIPELALVCFDRRIRVYTNFSANNPNVMDEMLVSNGFVDHTENRAFLADFDGDGISEIYVGNDVFKFDFTNPNAPTLTKILQGTGDSGKLNRVGTFTESTVAADLLSVANCNGDPDCEGLEIAAGSVIYSVDVSTTDGDGYQIKVQKDLNTLQNTSTYNDGYTAVADVDLDGILDVVVTGSRAPATNGVYVWNKNGLVDFLVLANPRVGALASIANVYDDQQAGFAVDYPEIILAIENEVVCLNLNKASATPASPFWWDLATQDASGVTGVTVFDFNGDGIKEIVYRDELNLRILYGGPAPFPAGVDPSRNWSSFIAGSGTFDEHPVVADVDLDGQAEIVVPSYTFAGNNNPVADYRGRLRVFESDLSIGDPWMSARDIWNQFNYYAVNINDDLTLPVNQQLHHLEFPIGSGNRPYNTYLAQIPLLDEDFMPFLPLPDVALTIDSIICNQNVFLIYFEVCNLQEVTYPQGSPITFYDGNPTTSNATAFNSNILIPEVPGDSCISTVFLIPAIYNTPIFMVVNDDASLAPIFDLTTDFPVTNILECDFTNNMDSISFDYTSMTLDLGPDQLVCQNGVFNLDAGSGFAEYLWFDGSTEPTYTAFEPGQYWVDVWDACGFMQSDTIRIDEDQATVFDIPDSTFCGGNSISITVNGFDDYQWFPDDGSIDCMNCPTVNITPITDSVYTLVASTNNGCISVDSFKLIQGGAATTRDTIYICEGSSALIFGNMETLAADYSETYPVQGICDSTHITTLIVNENPIASILSVDASCGANNGSATATASGGDGSYFYLWNDNQTTASIQGLSPGSYSLTVTDGNGCFSTANTQIGQAPPLQVSSQVVMDIDCNGNSTGAATASASNGSPPFSYIWSNATLGQNLQNVPAGTYTVTVTDTNNCSNTATVTLTEPTALTNNFTLGNNACNGTNGGSITANVQGGNGPYTFEWSNSFVETTGGISTISALPTGNYSLTITDDDNCTLIDNVSITSQAQISFTSILTPVSCLGGNDGSATITPTGGTAPYTVIWSDNQTGNTASNLMAGGYGFTVTDLNGCQTIDNITITEPATAVSLSISSSNVGCFGENNGSAAVAATGGTPNYTYLWSNTATGPTASNLVAGTYTVTATDANNCSNTATVILTEPTALTNNFTLGNNACNGTNGGSITANVQGGNSPYTFEWSNSFVETTGGSSTISALPSGNYSLTITDDDNCTLIDNVSITNQAQLSFTPELNPVSCLGGNDGSATITPTGGTAPYTVIWSTNQIGNTVSNLMAGVYGFTVTDSNGCQLLSGLTVTEPATAVSLSLTSSDASCFGQNDGSATVVASGGTPSYTYAWNNGTTDPTAFNLDAGDYTVTVTDQNGCKAVSTVSLAQPPLLSAQASSAPVTCEGDMDGSLLVTSIFGGIPPYTFSLDGSIFQVDSLFDNLAAGTYELTVKDDYDCIFVLQETVSAGQSLGVAIDLGESTSIPLGDSVALETTLTPPTAPVTYSWLPLDGLSCADCPAPTLLPLEDVLYTVVVVDSTTGCTASDIIMVTVEKNQNIFIPNVFTPNGDGINDLFYIYGGQDVAVVRQFQVWDRWGELIFEAADFPANDPGFGWDGTFRGKRLNPSVLVYVAEVEFIDGAVETYKGDFTLLR